MCEPLKSDEIIPDIVHPLGKYWEQPNRDNILIDDKHALMSKHSLDGLHEYSMSIPTGVYTGKMWKSKVLGKWLLRWFGNENDKGLLPILSREILIREETPMNEPLKSAETIKIMEEAILCLHLELPENIINDVKKRWDKLKLALEKWEQSIREDQRKKCRDEWHDWFLNGTDSVVECENKILNAGKKEKP